MKKILYVLLVVGVMSCNAGNNEIEVNKSVFLSSLSKLSIDKPKDGVFIYWDQASCGGCRSKSQTAYNKAKLNSDIFIRFIVPPVYSESTARVREVTYIDRAGIMFDKYFGIDNVGIVEVKDNHVASIKNYNPSEMDIFEADLLALMMDKSH